MNDTIAKQRQNEKGGKRIGMRGLASVARPTLAGWEDGSRCFAP